LKVAEGKYSRGRNLYLPKTVAAILGLEWNETAEYHLEKERVYITRKQEAP